MIYVSLRLLFETREDVFLSKGRRIYGSATFELLDVWKCYEGDKAMPHLQYVQLQTVVKGTLFVFNTQQASVNNAMIRIPKQHEKFGMTIPLEILLPTFLAGSSRLNHVATDQNYEPKQCGMIQY